jgi:hypothetical protein
MADKVKDGGRHDANSRDWMLFYFTLRGAFGARATRTRYPPPRNFAAEFVDALGAGTHGRIRHALWRL